MKGWLLLLCTVLLLVYPLVYGNLVDVPLVFKHALKEVEVLRHDELEASKEEHSANHPAEKLFSFLGSTPYIKEVGLSTRVQLNAIKEVRKITGLRGKALYDVLREDFGCSVLPNDKVTITPDHKLPTPHIDKCPFPELKCNELAKYRSIDGTCNNLDFPHDGRSMRALARFLFPDYADDVEEPRRGKTGEALPSARAVSLSIFEGQSKPSGVHTLMLMGLGQLIDHDLSHVAISEFRNQYGKLTTIPCGSNGCKTTGPGTSECFPIPVASDDPDFSKRECLMFVRSQEYMNDGCQISARQQANQITSWIDASQVYGSTREKLEELRDRNRARGRLLVTNVAHQRPFLPQHDDAACRDLDKTVRCFLAGDERVNEHVGLSSLHTVFVRLHNHYEEQLHKRHPTWSGESLFQESKRLVTAVWQNIIYNEFLPILLGPKLMRTFGLKLETCEHYYTGYDPRVHGDITNGFATAAFRIGHSLVADKFRFTDKTYAQNVERPLSSLFFRPRPIYESLVKGTTGIDSIIFGLVSTPMETLDHFVSKELTTRLFSDNPPTGKGMDLVALNIQRGRDHGIPGYTQWRQFCGLSVPKDFNEMDGISCDVQDRLKKLYKHIEDVDLFAAGMAEDPVAFGQVGPTFGCIIANQFRNLRAGDRFWFETNDPKLRFTGKQLKNIREITLSRVFCDTLDNVDTMQKYSLLQPRKIAAARGFNSEEFYDYISLFYKGNNNERKKCSELPNINFELF